MRYLKRQSTNKRLLNGKGLIYTQYEDIEAQSVGAFLVPKGTSAQRPSSPSEGQVRYNTTNRQLEVYEFNSGTSQVEWKTFRLSEPQNITLQNLGNGDDTEVNFGILNDNFGSGLGYPTTPENIFVLVENVLQIANTNYTLTQNPCNTNTNQMEAVFDYGVATGNPATGTGAFKIKTNTTPGPNFGQLLATDFQTKGYHVGQTVVVTGSAQNNGTYTVTAVTTQYLVVDTALTTEANNALGNTFFLDGKSSITGNSYPAGYYITFGTAVPTGKPVNVLHNFDK